MPEHAPDSSRTPLPAPIPALPGPSVLDSVRAAFDAGRIPYHVDGQPSIGFQKLIICVEAMAHPDGEVPEIWVTDDNSSMAYSEDEFHGLWAVFYSRYGVEGENLFQSRDFGTTGEGRSRLRADLAALLDALRKLLDRAA
ncbi:hypothetical protein ACFC26_21940 [Kitasatospora purpeofusca]|uniref:hypothetical protein n=1 Tax=Kitasatospora purpeofusca TaxID=67352 RepID=UPI0035D87836